MGQLLIQQGDESPLKIFQEVKQTAPQFFNFSRSGLMLTDELELENEGEEEEEDYDYDEETSGFLASLLLNRPPGLRPRSQGR